MGMAGAWKIQGQVTMGISVRTDGTPEPPARFPQPQTRYLLAGKKSPTNLPTINGTNPRISNAGQDIFARMKAAALEAYFL